MQQAPKIAAEAPTLLSYVAQMDNRLSDRSKVEYSRRLKELTRRMQPPPAELTPEMVAALIRRAASSGEVADSTFRSYKSAAMYWLGQQAQALIASGGDHADYDKAFEQLRGIKYDKTVPNQARTSARKLKFFPEQVVPILEEYARTHPRAPNAHRAAAFARANLLVGLRPIEWFEASLASYLLRDREGRPLRDRQGRLQFVPMLVVSNAKTTHGRGNGPQRELLLHDISADELKAIMHFQQIAAAYKARQPDGVSAKDLAARFYGPINTMIRRALTSAGYAARDIPSTYSARHQVVADFKAANLDKAVIAAYFGHRSIHTHKEHYAPKRHGGRAVTFRPSPESLSAVTTHRITQRPESISPTVAAEAVRWAAEMEARKQPEGGAPGSK